MAYKEHNGRKQTSLKIETYRHHYVPKNANTSVKHTHEELKML
jgi:hypothetical protein